MTTAIDPRAGYSVLLQDANDGVIFNQGGVNQKVLSVTSSVASNALTAGLNPCVLDFRSATLTDGLSTSIPINASLSLVVPSGATLGTVDTVQSRLILLAINNAGTAELAIVNQAGGNDLSETGVISTTALSTGSDSDNVIYSTTARTNVAYRVVGLVDSTQATAGTWATPHSKIQGTGGNALTSMSSLGYGQTYQDVSGSRVAGTTYYNTTGKPIFIMAHIAMSASTGAEMHISGVKIGTTYHNSANGGQQILTAIIPSGLFYKIVKIGSSSINKWSELR